MSSITPDQKSLNLQKLWTTSLYSDMELICNGHKWYLHRAVVHQSAPSFAANRLRNDDDDEEADDATLIIFSDDEPYQIPTTIILDGENPDLLGLVAQYFYKHTYADDDVITELDEESDRIFYPAKEYDEEGNTVHDHSEEDVKSVERLHSCLFINIYVYHLAVTLDVPGLKQHAMDKFKKRLEDSGKWPYYKFTEIVAAMFDLIHDYDDDFYSAVRDVLIENANDVLSHREPDKDTYHEAREDWVKVLDGHTEFMLALWQGTAAAHAATVKKHRESSLAAEKQQLRSMGECPPMISLFGSGPSNGISPELL